MARMLIADDDAVSRRFLADAAREAGWSVVTAADGLEALTTASRERFDLLLLDLAMPGLGGAAVWQHVQNDPAAASHAATAVATSAELSPTRAATLRATGFADAMPKPLALAEVWRILAMHHPSRAPLFDDETALRALGAMTTVRALRRLFGIELNALPTELDRLHDDPIALRERLHRLSASCGFCGAAALDAACQELRHDLDKTGRIDSSRMATLRALAIATRDDLAVHDAVLLESTGGAGADA